MACRSLERAQAARNSIIKEHPNVANRLEVMELDVSNFDSVHKFVEEVAKKHKTVDILLNNAGISFKGDTFDEYVVKTTLQTNFFGMVELTEKMLPHIKENGKVITIGSQAGYLGQITSKELRQRFLAPAITTDELKALAKEFIEDVKTNQFEKKGWAKNGYGTSKILVNTFTSVLARYEQVVKKNIQVYVCCPGWVKTDLGGEEAERTIEQGIVTPVYLV